MLGFPLPRQAEDELPLESQIQQCAAKAESLGARVDRIFVDEGRSGRYDDRPDFQAAIAYCEVMSPDYLITWSTSRFARNKIDAGMYKLRLAKAGIDIQYVSLNIDRNTDGGWVTESVLELFDELYSRAGFCGTPPVPCSRMHKKDISMAAESRSAKKLIRRQTIQRENASAHALMKPLWSVKSLTCDPGGWAH